MSNTRAHPRYALEIDAEIAFADARIPARTRNISRGGLSVDAARAVPVGQDVSVTISLVFDEQQMSEPLELLGRVVWSTRVSEGLYQIGVTFVRLTHDQRLYIEMFLRYLDDM